MQIQKGWYRQYNGGYFKVVDVLQYISDDYYSEEILVEDRFGIRWSHPLETFFEKIKNGNKIIPKFIYIGKKLPEIFVAE